jgi:cob(I)alamin adenosyltransferase
MLEKGLVQIYTGDGKGKTTAAFGLALRAAGNGNKVLIYQFLKPLSIKTGERIALQNSSLAIELQALDVQWDMFQSFKDEKILAKTRDAIKQVLQQIATAASQRDFDCIILDEIVYCVAKGLAKIEDIKKLIEQKDSRVEIVMTGSGASRELIDSADLVTEMKKIKHPFDKGTRARSGIEF